jgi:hypothetical protein
VTDIRHVYPKEATEAERLNVGLWEVRHPDGGTYSGVYYNDAEFAAAFVDAAVLNELVDAARVFTEREYTIGEEVPHAAYVALRAALARFDSAPTSGDDKP